MSIDQDFLGCPFYEESSNELRKHETLSAKNVSVLSKSYDNACHLFSELLSVSKSEKHLGEVLSLSRKAEHEKELLASKLRKGKESNTELNEESSNLRSQLIDKQNEMPLLAQEVERLKEKFKEIQTDENATKGELEQQHKAAILTKDHYKKRLGCHIRLLETNDQGHIFIFKYDSSAPTSSETLPPKSAKLSCSLKKEWKLLDTNPALPNLEQLSKWLSKTQDIQGLLAYLSTTFKSRKQRAKGKEN